MPGSNESEGRSSSPLTVMLSTESKNHSPDSRCMRAKLSASENRPAISPTLGRASCVAVVSALVLPRLFDFDLAGLSFVVCCFCSFGVDLTVSRPKISFAVAHDETKRVNEHIDVSNIENFILYLNVLVG